LNLLFFTIEVERGIGGDPANDKGLQGLRRWSHRWIAVAIVGVVLTVAAGCVGFVFAGGDPSGLTLPEWVARVAPSVSAAAEDEARLQITSQPAGAAVTLDGRRIGSTPLTLQISRGIHTLVLSHPDAIDEQRHLTVDADMAMNVNMWLRRPAAMLLSPAYPGASITDASFLEDGRLALSVARPGVGTNSAQRAMQEPWIYDPVLGTLEEFATRRSDSYPAEVSISPDGHRLAYLKPGASASRADGPNPRVSEVWLATDDASSPSVRVFSLTSPTADSTTSVDTSTGEEEVHDLAWTPDGGHLLVTVRLVSIAGGYGQAPRSRLLLVDASSEQPTPPVELMTLPAEVVAGSYTWAPDGHWVAFLTQASTGSGGNVFVALCAVDTRAGGEISGFRYVADLGRLSDSTGPLPVAAAAWSGVGDGRLVYANATPKITVSNALGLPTTSGGDPGLFVATPAGPALTAEEGARLGTGSGLVAPAWLPGDGMNGATLIALAHSGKGSKPLVIRGIDPVSGSTRDLDVTMPSGAGGSGPVAARWDVAHGRVLVLARHDKSNSNQLDYWLIQLWAGTRGD
jgi:hypothetical protein